MTGMTIWCLPARSGSSASVRALTYRHWLCDLDRHCQSVIKRRLNIALILSALTLNVSGCDFIPKDGPSGIDLKVGAVATNPISPTPVGFAFVTVAPEVLQLSNDVTNRNESRLSGMAKGAGPDVSIGAGDILNIAIFESDAGGLFIPKDAGSRSGNFVQLPNQQVDASGNIVVPYADQPVRVLGRTARAVSVDIAKRLSTRAIEPQVVVSVVEHRGNEVSILGEVNSPQRFSIDPGGIHLLSAIARAGGPKHPAYETMVSIKRNDSVQKVRMSAIVKDPTQDVAMRPHDVVYLEFDPRYYLVLGATPSPGSVGGINNRRFTFENDRMALAEGIAKAGGLDNTRANPKEVFLFRYEPRGMLDNAGVNVSSFTSERVPTVYTLDLSKGPGFFLANNFQIRDHDIIFVSDAPEVDYLKFITAITTLSTNGYNSAAMVAVAK